MIDACISGNYPDLAEEQHERQQENALRAKVLCLKIIDKFSLADIGNENRGLFLQLEKYKERASFWFWVWTAIHCQRKSMSPLHKSGPLTDLERQHQLLLFQNAIRVAIDMYELHENSIYDPLTGAYNRRKLYNDLAEIDNQISNTEAENAKAAETEKPFAIIAVMIDLDYFKGVNDVWGHQVGDRALIQVCNRLQKLMKENIWLAPGSIYRYGGDEFFMLFSARDADQINDILQALQELFQEMTKEQIKVVDPSNDELTISYSQTYSIGVCVARDIQSLLKRNLKGVVLKNVVGYSDSEAYTAKESKAYREGSYDIKVVEYEHGVFHKEKEQTK